MGNFTQDALISFISSDLSFFCESLKHEHMHFYQESDVDNKSVSGNDKVEEHAVYRIIWKNSKGHKIIAAWLFTCPFHISVAKIVRKQPLFCLEVSALSSQLQQYIAELDKWNNIEIVLVSCLLPKLSTSGLLLMDMDSTAIEMECIDELAKLAGVEQQVAHLTEKAMQGKVNFEKSLRQRVKALTHANESIIETLSAQLPLMSGLVSMVAELKSHGWKIAIASGGFTPFANKLNDLLVLDAVFANTLVIKNNKLTGELTGRIIEPHTKANICAELISKWGIPYSQSITIGDGANDIPMIEFAALGISYHGKNTVNSHANVCIKKLDLHSLPYLLSI